MKPLTFISGALLIAAGAFTFFFYANAFAGVAFILGLMMLVSGLCELLAYLISGSRNRLPDTLLVEGAVNALLGFTVLNDQITDNTITLFFGIWILVAGICRIAQSFAVSRINGRQWFAVVPLAIIDAMLGIIMLMMPSLASVNSLFWIAMAFILNGFSIIVYALFMRKIVESEKALEARKRAEAKQREISEKRARRNALRKLSKDDREAILAEERAREEREAEEKRLAKQAEKEAKRAARNTNLDGTVKLTEDEVEEIREADARAEENESQRPAGAAAEAAKEAAEELPAVQAEELEPELRTKRGIINLERVEAKEPEVVFESPELPEVETLAEGGESKKREDILQQLDETELPEEDETNFTPLTLEELFADERFSIKPLSGKEATITDLNLTQTFTFDWLDKTPESDR